MSIYHVKIRFGSITIEILAVPDDFVLDLLIKCFGFRYRQHLVNIILQSKGPISLSFNNMFNFIVQRKPEHMFRETIRLCRSYKRSIAIIPNLKGFQWEELNKVRAIVLIYINETLVRIHSNISQLTKISYLYLHDRRDFKGSLGFSQFPFLSLISRLIYNERQRSNANTFSCAKKENDYKQKVCPVISKSYFTEFL